MRHAQGGPLQPQDANPMKTYRITYVERSLQECFVRANTPEEARKHFDDRNRCSAPETLEMLSTEDVEIEETEPAAAAVRQ